MLSLNPKFITVASLVFASLIVYHLIVIRSKDDTITKLERDNANLTNTNSNLSDANDKFSKMIEAQQGSINGFIQANREASENATRALISAQTNKPTVERVIKELVTQAPSGDASTDCDIAGNNLLMYYGMAK